MARMTQSELKAALVTELQQAEGYDSDELSEMQRRALDMYYFKPRGDELEGRSDALSGDVPDMVEATIAQMLPAFSGQSVCVFRANDEEDVEQSQLESDVVNDVIIDGNHGYTMFQEALRDALLLRNGWVKVWLDVRKRETRETLEQVPPEAVASLVMQLNEQPGIEASIVGELDEGALIDATVRIIQSVERFRVTAIDPTLMRWQSDFDSVHIDDRMRFLAEEWFPTRSELVERGYSKAKVAKLAEYSADGDINRRSRYRDQTSAGSIAETSMEQVQCYWIYYRYDSDGDGIAELHRILYAGTSGGVEGGEILEDEIVSFAPYATGTPFLQPHQLNGLGLFDKLEDVANQKTDTIRDWQDGLRAAVFPELAVNARKVDQTSATNRRPNGVILVDGEVQGNFAEVRTSDTGASSAAMLEYLDKMRSERAGASLDLQAAEMQIAGHTAHGVERQMSSKEQLAAMMTRTIAETLIRQTYLLTHRGMREWLTQPVSIERSDGFATAQPNQWPERERLRVKPGLSIAERNHRRVVMGEVIAKQEQLAAAGYDGILVDADSYHAALEDWGRASQLDTVERYFKNPRSPESQEAASRKAAQAEAQQQAQQQILAAAATAEQQAQAMQSAIDKYKHDTELSFKYWQESLRSEIEQLREEIASTQLEGAQGAGNVRSAQFSRAAGDNTQ